MLYPSLTYLDEFDVERGSVCDKIRELADLLRQDNARPLV